jgi:hypothetical protein
MSTSTGLIPLPRTADAVRRTLHERRPDLHDRFVAEFRKALAETGDDFATDRIDRVVGRWWAQAMVLLNPDPEVDAVQARLSAGDDSDLTEWWQPQEDGSQRAYRRGNGGRWEFYRVVDDAAL